MSYSEYFYEEMKDLNYISAGVVVPLVLKYLKVQSVVDVGCGTGLWLKQFKQHGVSKIRGIDGDWVTPKLLVIPQEDFLSHDIDTKISLKERFDLVVSLEVAEHLKAKSAADFVASLVSLGPVVLFSAAIPLQGGSRHINEQWPEYWVKLFESHGYVPVDCLRRVLWNDTRVSFFYAQNICFFVDEKKLPEYEKLSAARQAGFDELLPLVHPHMYLYYATRWRTVVPLLGKFPPKFLHFMKKVLTKIFRRG